MSDPLVLYQVDATSAIVTLNREDKRNALCRELITEMADVLTRAENDDSVRSVILTGKGKAFCAGMDLAEVQESVLGGGDDSPVWDDALRLANLYDQIYRCPKPTIAAVRGAAVAGGAGLVSVCDLALATPDAKLGYPEVRRGLVAAMVMPHLLRHVGERMARYLLLTGELIDGEEAARCGLVNAVASEGDLMTQAKGWARSLAEGGPQALTKTKELLAQFSQQASSIEEAAKASAAPRLSEECKLGLEAFFARKPVPWAPKDS